MTGELLKMISANQIRAARALLDWTQKDLAKKSGLSLRALNSIERGLSVPRPDNLRAIQGALENAQVEFLELDGVRRLAEKMEVIKFEGAQAMHNFTLDVIKEIQKFDGEILMHLSGEKQFEIEGDPTLDTYFQNIFLRRTPERILLPRGDHYVIGIPSTYRWIRPELFARVSYCVYGETVSVLIQSTPPRAIIIRNAAVAEMMRRQFDVNWAMADTPWFAKSYKDYDYKEPWSLVKAKEAREWIAANKPSQVRR